MFINVSASPFEVNKPTHREGILRRHVMRHKIPFVFVNEVGGNDDLVFDGHSVVLDAGRQKVAQLKGFDEDLQIIDLNQLPAARCDRT